MWVPRMSLIFAIDSSLNICRIRYLAMCRRKELFPGWTIADNIYEDYEGRQFVKQQSIFNQLLLKLQEKFNLPPLEENITPLSIERIHEILISVWNYYFLIYG